MNRQQIESQVLAVLATILKCDVGLDASRQNTPQWDSLRHIEVVFAIEEVLGIQFSEAEIAETNSVGKIINLVEQRCAT